jgi:hypothetical protein
LEEEVGYAPNPIYDAFSGMIEKEGQDFDWERFVFRWSYLRCWFGLR